MGANLFKAAVFGGLAAGACDLLYALIVFGMRHVPALHILESLAVGLVGRAAYRGGVLVALVGLSLHMLLFLLAAALFTMLSTRLRVLIEKPFVIGPLFGLALFAVTRLVTVPLAASMTLPDEDKLFLGSIAVYLLGVGLPIALITRHYRTKP